MRKYYMAALAAAMLLTACSRSTNDTPAAATPAASVASTSDAATPAASVAPTSAAATEAVTETLGYRFIPSEGIVLFMHQEAAAVLEALGEPLTFMEAPSCAFQGTDRIYGFGSYELTTYEKDGMEYLYDIYFLDDSITTEEGIYIGCSKADMEAAYGTGYEESSGAYTYEKDGMTLQFLTENGTVIAIRYNGAVEP